MSLNEMELTRDELFAMKQALWCYIREKADEKIAKWVSVAASCIDKLDLLAPVE